MSDLASAGNAHAELMLSLRKRHLEQLHHVDIPAEPATGTPHIDIPEHRHVPSPYDQLGQWSKQAE